MIHAIKCQNVIFYSDINFIQKAFLLADYKYTVH